MPQKMYASGLSQSLMPTPLARFQRYTPSEIPATQISNPNQEGRGLFWPTFARIGPLLVAGPMSAPNWHKSCDGLARYAGLLTPRSGTRAVHILGVRADCCQLRSSWPTPGRIRPKKNRSRPGLSNSGSLRPNLGQLRPTSSKPAPN